MKFIDSTLKDNLTRDKMRIYVSIAAVVVLSFLVFIGVYTLLDSTARADVARRNEEADVLLEAAESASEESAAEAIAESVLESELNAQEVAAVSEENSEISETAETAEVLAPEIAEDDASADEEETAPLDEEGGAVVMEETAAATTDPDAVEEYYASVYAASDINLRTGPGTGYDIVRVIHMGEGIDVTGRTASGWYRTYSGNYVLISLTTTEPVATTAAQTAATAATTAAPAQTTQARPTTPANNESSTAGSADTSGMTYYGTCHITFYGPQLRSDGTWSTGTATGTTCSEGRTVAADWSIFPAGTTIYLPNDPLGGDGYYTVEDRGSGVNGNHIDIYANGDHTVTDCEVYIVN